MNWLNSCVVHRRKWLNDTARSQERQANSRELEDEERRWFAHSMF